MCGVISSCGGISVASASVFGLSWWWLSGFRAVSFRVVMVVASRLQRHWFSGCRGRTIFDVVARWFLLPWNIFFGSRGGALPDAVEKRFLSLSELTLFSHGNSKCFPIGIQSGFPWESKVVQNSPQKWLKMTSKNDLQRPPEFRGTFSRRGSPRHPETTLRGHILHLPRGIDIYFYYLYKRLKTETYLANLNTNKHQANGNS